MGFKRGLIVGFGAGYVLGARAGRQRYEEIRRAWNQFTGSPRVQRAAAKTKETAQESAKRSLYSVQQGVQKAEEAVKDRLNKGGSGGGSEGNAGSSGDASTDPWRGNEVPDTAEGQLP